MNHTLFYVYVWWLEGTNEMISHMLGGSRQHMASHLFRGIFLAHHVHFQSQMKQPAGNTWLELALWCFSLRGLEAIGHIIHPSTAVFATIGGREPKRYTAGMEAPTLSLWKINQSHSRDKVTQLVQLQKSKINKCFITFINNMCCVHKLVRQTGQPMNNFEGPETFSFGHLSNTIHLPSQQNIDKSWY